ncbi:hypothetical protein [Nocardioides soli]|uniref:Uncharacterized protein n=1 Tax=Nocardioides soli TaxID=1036020 RepID=A0A7W4W167_9ACTN|nr:hypothetical protein [Nocardioides soli]MBB3045576.1 hypothetical protein [Nocardioides soli]
MLNAAATLRVHASWDIDATNTVVALRTLVRWAHAMLKEARELQKSMVAIIRSWRLDLLEEFEVGPIVAATVLCAWSHPGRVHSEATFAMLAGVAPGLRRDLRRQGRHVRSRQRRHRVSEPDVSRDLTPRRGRRRHLRQQRRCHAPRRVDRDRVGPTTVRVLIIEPALPEQASILALRAACSNRAVADSPDGGVAVTEFSAGGGTSYYPVKGHVGRRADHHCPIRPRWQPRGPVRAIYDTAASSPSYVYDVLTGTTTGCDGTVLCQARCGWDGPTGLGAPTNTNLFKGPTSTPYVYPSPTVRPTLEPDPTPTPTATTGPTSTPTPTTRPSSTPTTVPVTSAPPTSSASSATSSPSTVPGTITRSGRIRAVESPGG